jgi:hypothetical protein
MESGNSLPTKQKVETEIAAVPTASVILKKNDSARNAVKPCIKVRNL